MEQSLDLMILGGVNAEKIHKMYVCDDDIGGDYAYFCPAIV